MRLPSSIRSILGAALIALAAGGCSRSAQTYVERGNAQLEQGNLDAAVLEYRNAVEKDPMFAPARLKLAEAYRGRGTARARSRSPSARRTCCRATRTPS